MSEATVSNDIVREDTMSNNTGSDLAKIILAFLAGIIMIAIQFGFSVACIVIGSIYRCDDDMDNFLIVCGALGIVINILKILHKLANPDDDGNGNMANLLCVVQICSCFWGMSLVWPFHKDACNDVLYGFAFTAANAWWIILGAILVCYTIAIFMISTAEIIMA